MVELISRMLDGSIPYDPERQLEPVSRGPGVKQEDKIERLKEIPIFEGCNQRQLRSVARIARSSTLSWPPFLPELASQATSSS